MVYKYTMVLEHRWTVAGFFYKNLWQPPMKRAVVAAAASIFVYPARTSFLAFSYIPTFLSPATVSLQSCRYYNLHTIVVLEHTYTE